MECSKLAICSAAYHFPQNPTTQISEKLKDLIRLILVPDPEQRPNITKVLSILDNYYSIPAINLPEAAQQVKSKQEHHISQNQKFQQQLNTGLSASSSAQGGQIDAA